MTRLLGQAAALGVPPASLLRADAVELPLVLGALEHAAEWQAERDRSLARAVVYELARAMKR